MARAILYALVLPVSAPVIAYRHKRKGRALRELFVKKRKKPRRYNVRRIEACLWSSRSAEALHLLQQMRRGSAPDSREHVEASQAIALRLSAQGNHAGAAEILASIPIARLAPNIARSVGSIRAQALQKAGRLAEARGVLEKISDHDSSCFLVLSNTERDADRKIEIINQVMRHAGLMEIRRVNLQEPISIFNLAGTHRKIASTEHGKVSVVFPVYNSERTIATAVRSIQDQTYRNIEIILVDDSSTDSTPEVLAELAAACDRIKFIRAPENGGAYRARNLGLAHSSGDFVTTHDADDWSHPEKIERQVRAFQADEALVATGSYWARVDPNFDFTSWELRPNLVRFSYPSFMVRRHVFDEIGPWDPVRISGDAEFMYRVRMSYGAKGVQWIAPEAPLGFSLAVETSLTNTRSTHASSSRHGLRRYYHETFKYQWRAGDATSSAARAARLSMLPEGMLRVGGPGRRYDYRLSGDLTKMTVVEQIVALCDKLEGAIAITHDPVVTLRGTSYGQFCDSVFGLFQRPNVFPEPEMPEKIATRDIPIEPISQS